MIAPNLREIRDMAFEKEQSALRTLGEMPQDLSVTKFISASLDVGRFDHYKFFPTPAQSIINRVRVTMGEEGSCIYLRAVLAHGVVDLMESERFQRLPPLVSHYHTLNLSRIAGASDERADWLNINHDLFQKEFGLVTLRLYAAGAQLVDYRCGIPRSLIYAEGPLSAPGKLKLILKLGGFKPFFQIHLHKFNLDSFSDHIRNETYRCCVELYGLHRDCLGMFAISWFYDPSLEKISPQLSYLRTIPMERGAHVLFVAKGGEATANSLSKSPTRRKLYEEGTYSPKNYMLVWGKQAQIAWAKNS